MRRDEVLDKAERVVDALSFRLFLLVQSSEVMNQEIDTAGFDKGVDELFDGFDGRSGLLFVLGFGDIVIGQLLDNFDDRDSDVDVLICALRTSFSVPNQRRE